MSAVPRRGPTSGQEVGKNGFFPVSKFRIEDADIYEKERHDLLFEQHAKGGVDRF